MLDIEIIRVDSYITIGMEINGWKGSARINGKVYTGEFSKLEEYEGVEIDWTDYL